MARELKGKRVNMGERPHEYGEEAMCIRQVPHRGRLYMGQGITDSPLCAWVQGCAHVGCTADIS